MKLKKFKVTITMTVKAENSDEAFAIGSNAFEEIYNNFDNSDEANPIHKNCYITADEIVKKAK